MRSPFPGMDPYLESRWSDVHVTLITLIREAIQGRLPPDLRARSEERVLLETVDDEPMPSYRSDVAVIEIGPAQKAAEGASPVATLEPIKITFHNVPEVDRSIHIIDVANGNRVVTAIEILSPGNKAAGRLNKDYLKKLSDYAKGEVSVVEIDLLREPPRTRLWVTDKDIPVLRRQPYMVCTRKGWHPEEWLAFPISLRQPLPITPIPLRRTDAQIDLELQPLIERVYVGGGHDDIDYSRPPIPALNPDDAAWAAGLLQSSPRR